jgi:hypothetical protein
VQLRIYHDGKGAFGAPLSPNLDSGRRLEQLQFMLAIRGRFVATGWRCYCLSEIMFIRRRDRTAWDSGFCDGFTRRPNHCPAGLDVLVYKVGYLEGQEQIAFFSARDPSSFPAHRPLEKSARPPNPLNSTPDPGLGMLLRGATLKPLC